MTAAPLAPVAPAPMTPGTPVGLAARLRAGTRAAHEQAESSTFVGDLMAGRLPVAAYVALVTQHLHLYTALERWGTSLAGHPVADALVALTPPRVSCLRADLTALLAATQIDPPPVEEATKRYVERLDHLAATWPEAFAAHHYVRVLGDVSGGQVVRRALLRHHPAYAPAATSFYDFSVVGPLPRFKERYRALLDLAGAAAGEDEPERLVGEARVAFGLNQAVFADLSARFA